MNSSRRSAIDPQLLYAISLIGCLLLSWRALHTAMQGNGDIVNAGIRLLVSVGFIWTGGYLVSQLIGSYFVQAEATLASKPTQLQGQRVDDMLLAGDEGNAVTPYVTTDA